MERYKTTGRLSKASAKANIFSSSGLVFPQPISAYDQTVGILKDLDALLEEAGFSKASLMHCLIHLRDMRDYDEVNRAYDAWIDAASVPSRTCVTADLPNRKALVEITATAIL